MTVATKTQPNYTTQDAASYKANIDGITAVHDRLAGAFAPHEQNVGSPAPDLTLRVDAGFVLTGSTLTEVSAQTVSGFTTPSAGEERIDRVVIDAITGVASRVAGTAVSGSPSAVAPAIPAGKLPCCQVRFTDASTSVLNSMITDERASPSAAAVPSGVILDFGGTSVPTGYLGCDGAAYGRTSSDPNPQPALYTAIGTTWGVGDGSTTFNVPDFRRRVAVGSGGTGTGTLANSVGSTGGAETHTLTTGEMPPHTHTVTASNAGGASFQSGTGYAQSGSTGSEGGGGAHNNMQPSAVVLKIIKT